ncbi:GNAT family N-acetyltransferase [Dyadobacter sp. CY343]|uniref:GNAT family N-acetyltransferase n=1 Tax=Dyadobacter sp. CY343 TaxID=2907299 RepID=UPI001F26FBDB|nr:GNAT family N-acetyltransferase [Dyadobacter sp. CY343]MCE7058874.1 GNAT family N-acetyltransferase [Dyadobacter sp. CY343]
MFTINEATTEEDYCAGGQLFNEYASSLDFSLSFQSFEDELKVLPEMYGPPTGALLLVEKQGEYIGVAGLRRIENDVTCEVKRMYIQPGFQGAGIGKALLNALIEKARELGYKTVKLDTLGPKMPAAVKLYKSFGFMETAPYNFNPYEGILYFEKQL